MVLCYQNYFFVSVADTEPVKLGLIDAVIETPAVMFDTLYSSSNSFSKRFTASLIRFQIFNNLVSSGIRISTSSFGVSTNDILNSPSNPTVT